jgi:lambda repressor-like predicted transcriptional regulator
MHPADIQAALKKAGLTQKAVAEEYGCSVFHVHRIIHEQKGSEPLMKFICQKIGKGIYEVFPDFCLKKYRKKAA